MTSPLRRNRQTTRPSIRRSKTFEAWTSLLAVVILAAASGPLRAGEPGAKEAALSPPPRQSPLRSAADRWRATTNRMKSAVIRQVSGDVAGRPAELLPLAGDTTGFPVFPGEAPIRGVATLQEAAPQQPGDTLPQRDPAFEPPMYVETSIDQILPFADYEPARVAAQELDCETVCPCPDGDDCRKAGGRRPCPCPEGDIKQPWLTADYTPRSYAETVFNWDASNLYSYPLYFEDPTLERYGHTHCELIQPYISIRRFSAQLLLLPYQMTMKPPLDRQYALGFYRPGEWAPKLFYQIPLNAQAALVQASVVTGSMLIFP